MGSYVCKVVCQFVGWGFGCYWVCLLVTLGLGLVFGLWVCVLLGWCLCDQIISFNSRDGVSVGLFYNPMDF